MKSARRLVRNHTSDRHIAVRSEVVARSRLDIERRNTCCHLGDDRRDLRRILVCVEQREREVKRPGRPVDLGHRLTGQCDNGEIRHRRQGTHLRGRESRRDESTSRESVTHENGTVANRGASGVPQGRITRGTTGVNRLRRVDRWIAALPILRTTDDPLVVDLGYGASATTTLELRDRLAAVRPDVEVIGVEIDPERVKIAAAAARDGVTFRLGGFETPTPGGRRPVVIRALNVLRQYDESEVAAAWATMTARLQAGGFLIEGTCNEVGRVASWVGVDTSGPRTFTISLRLAGLDLPSIVAERLPKALIHRNVPGERIHALLLDLDRLWAVHAPLAVYGPTQRWVALVESLRGAGWPVRDGRARWKLGELTLDWAAVAPA